MSASAVLLVGHGSVTSLDQLPAFLTSIRHGRAPSDELLDEVRRRYQAIGGVSPLSAVQQRLAEKLGAHLAQPVYVAARHGVPALPEVLESMRAAGVRRVQVIPLAQHSASIYAAAVREHAGDLEVRAASNWGQRADLLALFCAKLETALAPLRERRVRVLFSAHSLPEAVIAAGDPYEREVRAAAATLTQLAHVQDAQIVFQSQGLSVGPGGRPMRWLGPDLVEALDQAKADGIEHVLIAPVGFLADHVEILYDLDIEARAWAEQRGVRLSRTTSLNDDDDFVAVLARIAGELA